MKKCDTDDRNVKIDFGNTQNQTLNKLSCCVVMSAAFILFIAIIKLLSPRRLFFVKYDNKQNQLARHLTKVLFSSILLNLFVTFQ